MAYNAIIVDDSQPMRSIIIKTIKASGFNIGIFFESPNGKEAISIIKKEWLDIVITDYNMPDMNGIELIEAIKKDSQINSIPILVISTEGSKKKIDEFIKKGAAGYIKKPFTPELIKKKLNHILGETDEASFENSDDGLDF